MCWRVDVLETADFIQVEKGENKCGKEEGSKLIKRDLREKKNNEMLHLRCTFFTERAKQRWKKNQKPFKSVEKMKKMESDK